jgi:predicted O-methyltransferase YrrM
MSSSHAQRSAPAPRSTRDDPEVEARAAKEAPIVLHSLHEFGDVLLDALRIARPRRILEIGGEGGAFTRSLLDVEDATVVCVDPAPSDALRRLASESSRIELVEGYSPEALDGLEPCDAYIVDGDHCYAVVRRELDAIGSVAPGALVILHDVGWPCGRRDFYYGPERLAPDEVHPHSFSKGVSIESGQLSEFGGISGVGAMAIAEAAGGERNGILTAVEDFLAGRPDLSMAFIPCIYGVAVLYPAEADWAEALRAHMAPFDGSPLLARLEANRLKLLTRVLDLQGEVERRGRQFSRATEELERRIAELSAENLRLRNS